MSTQDMTAGGVEAGTSPAEPVRPMPRGVRRLAWALGVPIVVAMSLGSYLLSFTGLYWSFQVAAHFPAVFAGIAAVVLDLFISVCLLGDLLLKWAGLSSAVPATAAWLFTSLSVAANFYAGFAGYGTSLTVGGAPGWRDAGSFGVSARWVGGILHGSWPLMFVVVVEVGQMTVARWAKLRAPRDTKKRERVSRSRLMRWLMDPPGTLIMTRMRHMWLIVDEAEALELMRARKLAIGRLRDQYGRIWGVQVPLLWRFRSPLEKRWAVTTGRLDGGKAALSRVADNALRDLFSPTDQQSRTAGTAKPQATGSGSKARAAAAGPARTGTLSEAGTGQILEQGKQQPRTPEPSHPHISANLSDDTDTDTDTGQDTGEDTTASGWSAELEALYVEYAARLRGGDVAMEMTGTEIAKWLGRDPGHARNIRKSLRSRFSKETGVQFVLERGRVRRLEVPSVPAPGPRPDAEPGTEPGNGRPAPDNAQHNPGSGRTLASVPAIADAHPDGQRRAAP